jgi:N-acetylated-alpha-linked acidic dipeptidase
MRISVENHQDAQDVMLKVPKTSNLRHWSKLYSAEPHLAGDLVHASRIRDLWISYGIPSKLVRYDVLQNFPISASLSLHSINREVKYQAILEEPNLPEDPTSSPRNGLPTFHGYGANGSVTGKLVYANFGTIQDFESLTAHGVSVAGCIVICKYSKIFRALKVRAAEKFGAIGVLIYSDPQEDGEFTAANGYEAYPNGPARHPECVQRGSVDFFSVAVGDPTTPGYPSLPGDGTERRDPGYAIPGIPSLPISFKDALPFLQALEGKGLSAEEMGGDWKGCLDVKYSTGPSVLEASLSCECEFVEFY